MGKLVIELINYLFGVKTKMLCYGKMNYEKSLNLLNTPNALTPKEREEILNHFY